jgi:hypothetical protein
VILLIDDDKKSKFLIATLLQCDFGVLDDEDGRWIVHMQETISKGITIVHYTDLATMEKYRLSMPKYFPAVRIGRYSQEFKYFDDMSFGECIFPLLSLKQIIDKELRNRDLDNWNLNCKNLKQKYEQDFYWKAIHYMQKYYPDDSEVECVDGYSLDNCIKFKESHKEDVNFPKLIINLPPQPDTGNFLPWQEGYRITDINFHRQPLQE